MQKLSFSLTGMAFALALAICSSCSAVANDYKDVNYLIKMLPSGYVSKDSQLINLEDKTTKDASYRIMVIIQTLGNEARRKVKRVAIFKKNGDYVGVFSGFDDIPISVSSKGIHFPYEEELGNMIIFGELGPVAPAFVYGQHYLLEKSESLTREQALEQMNRINHLE